MFSTLILFHRKKEFIAFCETEDASQGFVYQSKKMEAGVCPGTAAVSAAQKRWMRRRHTDVFCR